MWNPFSAIANKLKPSLMVKGIAMCAMDAAAHFEVYVDLRQGEIAYGIRRKPDAPMIDIDGDGKPDA